MKHSNHFVRNSIYKLFSIFLFLSGQGLAAPACDNPKACASEALAAGELDTAYRLLLPLGESGDADAQIAIALILSNGAGTDEAKKASKGRREMLALPWIRRAALASNKQAMNWLADGYKNGWFGFAVDKRKEACLRDASAERISVGKCLD